MMSKPFVSLRCVMWTVLLISPVVHAQVCDAGWFGSRCQYKCYCTNNNCDNNGDCRDDDTCVKGWFGPQCQYVDLTYTEGDGTTKAEFTDADDTTCNDDMSRTGGTLNLKKKFPITWLRLHVSNEGIDLLQNIDVHFTDSLNGVFGRSYQCNNKTSAVVDSRTIDIYCDVGGEVDKVTYTGRAVGYLCSIYISGGRNIALKQSQVNQSSTFKSGDSFDASNAIDGNTDQDTASGSCTHTSGNEANPYWNVEFAQISDVNRYVIYNRGDGYNQYRLSGFVLTSFDQNNVQVFQHTDAETDYYGLLVYDITTATTASSIKTVNIVVDNRENILTLCEVEIYGDSHCPIGKYGRECEHDCHCASSESCLVSTGRCPNDCAAGYFGEHCDQQCSPGSYGQNCNQQCSPGSYGQNCNQQCSTGCQDSLKCNYVNGRCDDCVSGKTGEFCYEDCPTTKYGPRCIHECSTNCVNQQCEGTTGRCIQCPPGKEGDQCNQDCSLTTYGPRCIYKCSSNCSYSQCGGASGWCDQCPEGKLGLFCDKEEKIQVTTYEIIDIVNDTIITTSGNNMKVTGNVTLNKDGEEVSMAIPARSYVTVDDPIRESCLDNIDDCQSGFSLTTGHSFSAVDASELQVAMTTGAGLEDGVRGVSLYYRSGQVYSYVTTSTQEWSIAQDFQLVVNKWYDMTVSWSADQGLALLQGSDIIGSSQTPSKLPVPANISKPLTIGYPGVTSSAVMNVKGITTVPLFWKEVQRSGILFAKTSPSEDSEKDFVEILGIGIGSGAAVILTVVAVIIAVLFYRRKRNSVPLSPSASTMKGPDYITPSDHPYSEGSINTYADYLNPVYHDDTPANDYDYIGNDYLTIIEDTNLGDGMAVPPVSNKDVEHAYSRHIDSGDQN